MKTIGEMFLIFQRNKDTPKKKKKKPLNFPLEMWNCNEQNQNYKIVETKKYTSKLSPV